MAKRFIDTKTFDDEWVHELSKDGKLFFLYYITTCDHAGILRLNKKLCEFQTGISKIETIIKELGNSLVTVKDGVYFMPRFIKFQYPNFPQSNVKQQISAIKILKSLNLWDDNLNSYVTVTKELVNYYVNVNDNVIIKEKEEKIKIRENVFLKQTDIEKLKIDFGEGYEWAIDTLSNYKYSSGKKYKSDYHALIGWVKDKYITEKNKKQNGSSTNNQRVQRANELRGFSESMDIVLGVGEKSNSGSNSIIDTKADIIEDKKNNGGAESKSFNDKNDS